MSELAVAGRRVWYDDRGDGEPIILVHGGAATSRYWDAFRAELPASVRTIAPDLFGCGRTEQSDAQQTLTHDDDAAIVRAILDLVGEAHLVGHSYGAAVCLRVAVHSTSLIRTMTLVEPPIYRLLSQAGHDDLYREISAFRSTFVDLVEANRDEQAMQLLIDRFSGSGTWGAMSSRSQAVALEAIPALVVGFAANAENPTRLDECELIQVPTLLIWGEDTGKPEQAMVATLTDALGDARSVAIPHARHQSPLTHPGQVAALAMGHVTT